MFEKLYDAEAREVVLPGANGEFSVWDFHQPCLYSLRAGRITIIQGTGYRGQGTGAMNPEPRTLNPENSILIKKGMAQMVSNRLTIMAEI